MVFKAISIESALMPVHNKKLLQITDSIYKLSPHFAKSRQGTKQQQGCNNCWTFFHTALGTQLPSVSPALHSKPAETPPQADVSALKPAPELKLNWFDLSEAAAPFAVNFQ